jgi:hypothetical protein
LDKSTDKRPKRAKPRLGVRFAGIFGILFGIVVVLGIAGEIVLRVTVPGVGALGSLFVKMAGDSRAYGFRPGAVLNFPGTRVRFSPKIAWRINSDGYRANAPTPAKSDKFRVLVFGDSEGFGWALDIEQTFHRMMEKTEPRLEVLNLSVPGYNAENIADYMKQAVPKYRPDLIFYMFHKNDMDPPLTFHPWFMKSYFAVFLRTLYASRTHQRRIERRRTPVVTKFLKTQFGRMQAIARQAGTPLMFGILHWHYRDYRGYLSRELLIDRAKALPADWPSSYFLSGVNLGAARVDFPLLDRHISAAGHAWMAQRICAAISGKRTGACIPPGWVRGD